MRYASIKEIVKNKLTKGGELVEDDRREARQSMLDAYPSLTADIADKE